MNVALASQFNMFLDHCTFTKAMSRPTIRGYGDVFRLFAALMPEVTHATQLNAETLDQFFIRLQRRQTTRGNRTFASRVKASTIRTYASKLHTFCDWLLARGEIASNPVMRANLPKVSYTDRRALSRIEIDKLLSAITQHAPNRFQLKRELAMVHVLLFAGLRRGELLALKVSNIDLTRRIVTVDGRTSKSQRTRHIPITAAAVMHLEDYLQERRKRRSRCEHLWLSTRGDSPLTCHGLRRWVERLRVQSGVHFHVHRFRHTFACMLGGNNVSAIKVQKLMGHTDLRMTQTYMRSLGVEDVRDSIQHLSLDSLASL